ncbi:Bdr family repetitive protein [Borreliella valaisiana]|uniref:Bdr family repetitive protein n=1 Tax=Borreliella valaisiana TaxID=62088 RepID=UPI001AEFC713|nr:Bdr family repetitive protein [Borreliella valaisiana]
MSNLAHNAVKIKNIRLEFLNKGFSEEAIDFVFLHNDNYNFEYLKEKLIDVEKTLRKDISNLDTKIDNVKNELNVKIDSVEKNLQKDISILNTKIDNEVKNLRKDLNMGNRLIHFMILVAAIFGPILNALFMKYLQYIK